MTDANIERIANNIKTEILALIDNEVDTVEMMESKEKGPDDETTGGNH